MSDQFEYTNFYTYFKALGLIFGFYILWFLVTKLKEKLEYWNNHFVISKINSLKNKRVLIIDTILIHDSIELIISIFILFARLFVIYLSGTAVLLSIPLTAGLSKYLAEQITFPLNWLGTKFISVLPNLIFIFVISLVTHYFLKLLKFIFAGLRDGRITVQGFYPDWANSTYQLVRFFVIAVALVICFPYIPGSSSPAFQGLSVFLGILLSIGSTSAIGNMIAGLVITYMRPFKVGDMVKISDSIGVVIAKDLLVTRLLTPKNVEVTVPNATVLSNHIINYSAQTQISHVIFHTSITIGYDVPWNKVHQAMIEAALRTDKILTEPGPFVLQTSLNDFHVSYELNVSTKEASLMPIIQSELNNNIQIVFAERSIEIMSPGYLAMRDGNKSTIPQLKN